MLGGSSMKLLRPGALLRGPWALLHGMFAGLVAIWLLFAPASLRADAPEGPKFVLAWGKKGEKPGEFVSPIGIAINKNDEVFVTDLNNARVQKFSTEGAYLGGFDLPRDKPERRSCLIGGIAVDADGLLYLSFMLQDRVAVYTGAGEFLRQWGKRGKGHGEFNQPGGIVLAPGGTVYVADQGNHRIEIFDTEGTLRGKWDEHGSGTGLFGGNATVGLRLGGQYIMAGGTG